MGRDVHGHASDVVTPELDFAGVEARPQFDAELSRFVADPEPQRMARPGPSNVARNPSPIVLIFEARKRASWRRTSASCVETMTPGPIPSAAAWASNPRCR